MRFRWSWAVVVAAAGFGFLWLANPTRSQDAPDPALLVNDKFHGNLARHGADEEMSVIVFMKDAVDIDALSGALDAQRASMRDRHEAVVTTLQARASVMLDAIMVDLADKLAAGEISRFDEYWIANAVRVDGPREVIQEILQRDDVERVYYNYGIEGIRPVEGPSGDVPGPLAGGVEPGIDAVRAPEVWAMGYDGTGVLVANMDTGVDGNHPALASRWRGVADPRYANNPEWAWFDPFAGQNNFPYDNNGHGTHTMGSVCGGSPGDGIGVAPGAQWIAAGAIDRGGGIPQTVADAMASFQWFLDPDGDPQTNFDVPAVCSNSWGLVDSHGYPPCDEAFWSFLDACEAGGIIIVFSAGNEGFSGLRRPGDRATNPYDSMAVAAVDANTPSWPIASFSSRGPTFCTPLGNAATKPDISAPGVSVRSALPGGGYGSLSGTSMASPHINGVIALMRQANPDLPSDQIKQIIYDTAFDLGSAGEDNDYGWGMVDAVEAVTAALALTTLTFDFPSGRPEFVHPNGGTTIRVVVSGQSVQPEPGTGMLHYDNGSGTYTAIPMQVVSPNVYDAVFPSFPCGDNVTYYFSAETVDNEVVTNPFSAPDSTYASLAYAGTTVSFSDNFSSDTGWSVVNDPGLSDGPWERAVPAGGGDRGDPATDSDGSGPCYVTDNADDNSDVDDGSTYLISPILDFTAGADAIVEYDLWYTNNVGADPNNDLFNTYVSNDGGSSWVLAQTFGPVTSAGWSTKSFRVADFVTPTANGRVRFQASDLNSGSVVEAGIDAFRVFSYDCGTPDPTFTVALSSSNTTVSRGSAFLFDLSITNDDGSNGYDVDLWAARDLPGGGSQDPWRGPKPRSFTPGQTRDWTDLSINVGSGAALGTYRLYVRVGEQIPGPVWGEDFIEYTVVP